MPAKKKNRKCSVDGCVRKHAANGFCLMHYKRVQKTGSPNYSWGGKVVSRCCKFCDRVVVAKEMCFRHYQMNRKHGDPLYSDKKKINGFKNGEHFRRGYKMVCPVVETKTGVDLNPPTIQKSDAVHKAFTKPGGFRDGSKRNRREWEHRKKVGAQIGQIVHHIDGAPLNNDVDNLHVFNSPKEHAMAHRSLEKVAYSLLRKGFIKFDKKTGLYSRVRLSVVSSSLSKK